MYQYQDCMSNKTTKSKPETAKENKLYNISGKLTDNVEIKTNTNGKKYALAKVENDQGKSTTVLTYVKAGMEALKGKKKGAAVRLFGTYTKGDKGRTFSAMGISAELPKKAVKKPARKTADMEL